MKKGFVQAFGWTLVIIWIAVGIIIYSLGLSYYIGNLLSILVYAIWLIIFLYVQGPIFGQFNYDESDKLVLSDEDKESYLVGFCFYSFFGLVLAHIWGYITLLSFLIIIFVGAAIIYFSLRVKKNK